ncbi:MAG: ABC transporter permease subunit [Actinophytocola sp.]|uniref:ABC transporter permease n=1 Tax=Actinophytocola sp. TaxID=1872138 RepID=UPI0013272C70|nr:ABC transporter permease [Actinophytocola sp.]MPZ79018.1 ABC transporter permease subunit [Actinophytocola sp.]
MNPAITRATALRLLTQLRHDHRTVALLFGVPVLLMVLLRYVFNETLVFNHIAPSLLGIFPFTVMFLVTSVATLRERTTGTLERLMTMPMAKLDLLLGYAIAFGLLAVVQVVVVVAVTLWLGLSIAGSLSLLLAIAVLDALLGTALGLFVSAFARTEFQVVQFMPAIVMPQILLSGLFVPREEMARPLEWLSDVLPLSHAVDATNDVTRSAEFTGALARDLLVITGAAALALVLGAATLRRRTR